MSGLNTTRKNFGVKLTDDLLGWLQKEADRLGETQATVVRNLIRQAMESAPTGSNTAGSNSNFAAA